MSSNNRRFVVLHLKDRRRLYGWPYEWPDYQDCGRFILVQAEWLLDNNQSIPLDGVEKVIIPTSDVAMVETMKESVPESVGETVDAESTMVQEVEEPNGKGQ